jgi:hypothetical protein
MRKDVQEALELAITGFEKRQQAEQERLRERERFETDWARIRTAVVLPALEERPFHSLSGEQGRREWRSETLHDLPTRKAKNTVLVDIATKTSAAPVGSFALDKITEDFVQTEATKFFTRVASEAG